MRPVINDTRWQNDNKNLFENSQNPQKSPKNIEKTIKVLKPFFAFWWVLKLQLCIIRTEVSLYKITCAQIQRETEKIKVEMPKWTKMAPKKKKSVQTPISHSTLKSVCIILRPNVVRFPLCLLLRSS